MKVRIASVESELFCGEALAVVTETMDGALKIFPGHTPLLGLLRPGLLRIYAAAQKNYPQGRQYMMLISGGYLEVQRDSVTILADAYERESEIDAAQAKRMLHSARETFRHAAPDAMDKAMLDLEMAIARMNLARRSAARH